MTYQTIDLKKLFDIIIVGAGAAGLAAAIQAKDEGASPVIFEKMPAVRGNTIKSSAGMNASETSFQLDQGITDSNELFYAETLIGGNKTNDQELLQYFVKQSAGAIDWLDSLGISLSNITTTGGMSVRRTHRPADGSAIGGYLVKRLMKNIEERHIPIVLNADVQRLVLDKGVVTGVEVVIEGMTSQIVKSRTVIVTTGGFGFNREMLNKIAPQTAHFITTNHEGSMGDGIQMIQAVGGDVRDLDQIQIHPTVHQESGFLMTEAIRGEGAVLVSSKGERFINELDRRDVVSKAVMDLTDHCAYLIFDEHLKQRVPAVGFYQSKQMVLTADTLADLAGLLGMQEDTLKDTIYKWNESVREQKDRQFARQTGMDHPLNLSPYHAIKIAPGIHHTMGGVIIDKDTQVLKPDGQIIPGLYAAGETVGGLHGQNRIGGNAIAETIVFGRQAGKQAAQFSSKGLPE